jgi:hypothetical protein
VYLVGLAHAPKPASIVDAPLVMRKLYFSGQCARAFWKKNSIQRQATALDPAPGPPSRPCGPLSVYGKLLTLLLCYQSKNANGMEPALRKAWMALKKRRLLMKSIS